MEILEAVLPPAFILWPFVGMRCLCLYQKSIFLGILRGTGMTIIIVVHFTPSAQTSDGQSSQEGGWLVLMLTRASSNRFI